MKKITKLRILRNICPHNQESEVIISMETFIRASENTLYRQGDDFQLWAHLHNQKLTLQLESFLPNGQSKVYGKVICQAAQGGKKLTAKQLFSALSCHSELIAEITQYDVKVLISEIPTLLQNKNEGNISLRLPEKKYAQRLDNFMMISMFDEHIKGLSARTGKVEETLKIIDWEDPEPILHQTAKYCFRASYAARDHAITTSLWINSEDKEQQIQYRNIITEQYFGTEIKNTFGNMENLFEHLRNYKNYEVNYDAGRIKIINQPKDTEELELLARKTEHRKKIKKSSEDKAFSVNSETSRPSFITTQTSFSNSVRAPKIGGTETDVSFEGKSVTLDKRFSEQANSIQQVVERNLDKKFITQQSKIMMTLKRQLANVEVEISDKLYQLSKGIKIQNERPSQKKIDIEILEEWKQTFNQDILCKVAQQDRKVKSQLMSLITQAKRQLAIIIHKLRSQFDNMIRENQDKCMQSIDDLQIDLIEKIQLLSNPSNNNSVKQSTPSVVSQENESLYPRTLRNGDWNPIHVEMNSAQFSKFIVELDNVIIYNSGWEWTQLFTRTIIPHGKIIALEFKIIKSAYNAIAIGVSDRANNKQKTSLSLKNSIAYWGDREVWEGKKVKQQGIGFKTGDTVTMRVDTIQGIITWGVGNDLRAQHTSPILRDRSLHLMGYIQMYDKGDKIQMLSYKYIE